MESASQPPRQYRRKRGNDYDHVQQGSDLSAFGEPGRPRRSAPFGRAAVPWDIAGPPGTPWRTVPGQAAVFARCPRTCGRCVLLSPRSHSGHPGPLFRGRGAAAIFDALHLDDAADFLEELPANLVTRILRSASPQRRMAVNALLRYPADSAGSVMTPEFVSLRPGDTVRQALDTIRRTGIHKETVYTCYVLEHRQLLGVVSAKDLLTAAEDAAVADLMVTDVVSVGTLTDREEAARLLAKYDLLALAGAGWRGADGGHRHRG